MATIPSLNLNVKADTSKADMGLSKTKSKIKDVGLQTKRSFSTIRSQADRTSKSFGGMGKSLFKSMAALEGIKVALRQVGDLARGAMSFEDAMAEVAAFGEMTRQEFDQLTDKAREMARKSIKSADEVGRGFAELTKAGLKPDQINKVADAVLNLSVVSRQDMGQAAIQVTDIMETMSLKAEDLTDVIDVLMVAAKKSPAGVADMAGAFKMVGTLANEVGMDVRDVSKELTFLARAGQRGEEGGAALSRTLLAVLNPASEAGVVMKELGVNLTDANGKFVGMVDVTKQIDKAIKQQGIGVIKAGKIWGTVFGRQGVRSAIALKNVTTDSLKDIDKAFENTTGAAAKGTRIMSETTSSQFEKMKSEAQEQFIQIAVKHQDLIKKIINGFTSLLSGAADVFNGITIFAEMGAQLAVLGFAGMANDLIHFFTEKIPAGVKWFGENFVTIITDALKNAWTGFKGFFSAVGAGWRELVSAIKDLRKPNFGKAIRNAMGNVKFVDNTTPFPKVKDRELTAFEKRRMDRIRQLGKQADKLMGGKGGDKAGINIRDEAFIKDRAKQKEAAEVIKKGIGDFKREVFSGISGQTSAVEKGSVEAFKIIHGFKGDKMFNLQNQQLKEMKKQRQKLEDLIRKLLGIKVERAGI